MFVRSLAIVAALLSAAQAVEVQVVYVGQNPANNVTGLKYWPENIKAEPGTMVQFQFWAGNHTVTQSSFDSPCTPLKPAANGSSTNAVAIKSGFMPVAASMPEGNIPTFTVMINDTKPLWFYCGQGPHCQKGMSMVINEKPSSGKTLAEYKLASENTSGGGGYGYGGGNGTTGGGSGSGSGEGSNGGSGGSGDGTSGGGATPSNIPGNPNEVGNPPPSAAAAIWPWTSSMLLVAGAALAMF